jgi:hypothetical protein
MGLSKPDRQVQPAAKATDWPEDVPPLLQGGTAADAQRILAEARQRRSNDRHAQRQAQQVASGKVNTTRSLREPAPLICLGCGQPATALSGIGQAARCPNCDPKGLIRVVEDDS